MLSVEAMIGFQSEENLNKIINQEIEQIFIENSRRDGIFAEIKSDLLRQIGHNCGIHFSGSRVIGVATKNSDCDIYFDHDGSSYATALSQELQKEKIAILLHHFRSKASGFEIREYVLTARVPVLKMIHLKTKILCDLSCASGLSVENTYLTRLLLSSDFRVSWLVITVKWWMKSNNLLNKFIFTSHSITWLVFFFLMQVEPNILQSVQRTKRGCPAYSVGGWDCRLNKNFYKDLHKPTMNKDKRIYLLKEFYKYYATFDFKRVVLCPLNGFLMPRKSFDNLTLPPEFSEYVRKARSDPSKRLQTGPDYVICLQDPYDLSHNITKVVDQENLDKFRNCCFKSLESGLFSQSRWVY